MRPAVSRFTEYVYAALSPLAQEDEANDWALLRFVAANASMFDEANEYARDGEYPGWSSILDIDRAPAGGLDWLAQFVGVTLSPDVKRLLPGETEPARQVRLRRFIRAAGGQKRGSPGSLKEAVRHRLTGNKTLVLRERDGSAWRLTAITYAEETPNAAEVLRALKANKPAGIILNHTVAVGINYSALFNEQDNYLSTRQTYENYDQLRMRVPRPGQQYVELRGVVANYSAAATRYSTYTMLQSNINQ